MNPSDLRSSDSAPLATPTESTDMSENVSTLSKKKAKKALKVTQKIKVVPGSVDTMVQHTNDDSVVSKRSAVSLGYFADPFLRHFVARPKRRAPLINRGYYLRMLVMTDLLTRAINSEARKHLGNSTETASWPPQHPVQIISLGAGYDTFAFRTLCCDHGKDQEAYMRLVGCDPLLDGARPHLQFFDVDFPAVMRAKAALMQAAPAGSFPLANISVQPNDADDLTVRSDQYHALGVDLRAARETLLSALRATAPTTHFDPTHPTVIYAECVMQYMPASAAEGLLQLLAEIFPCATFIAYDQIHPDDSFGRIMTQTLRQKKTPLLGIDAAPDGKAMLARAARVSMTESYFANFHDFSRHYIHEQEYARLRTLEPFDELEEWAEMCEHYGITVCYTSSSPAGQALPSEKRPLRGHPSFSAEHTARGAAPTALHGLPPLARPAPTLEVQSWPWPSGRFGFEGWGQGDMYAEQHPTDPHEVIVVGFGGFSVGARNHQRVSTVFAHGLRHGELKVVVTSQAETQPPALVFHSFTRIAPFTYVVLGGRTSPSCGNDTAYLLELEVLPGTSGDSSTVAAQWSTLKLTGGETDGMQRGASSPRLYRHVAVALPDSACVFVFGGSHNDSILGQPTLAPSHSAFLVDVDVRNRQVNWASMKLTSHREGEPLPCTTAVCSLAGVALENEWVLLSGGVLGGADPRVTGLWKVNCRSGECVRVAAQQDSPLSDLQRFSHSMTRLTVDGADKVLILGGCTPGDKSTNMPSLGLLIDCAGLRGRSDEETVLTQRLPTPALFPPSLAGHSVAPIANGILAVMGGGYTCFSFGTFSSKPFLIAIGQDYTKNPPWAAPSSVLASATVESATAESSRGAAADSVATTAGLVQRLLSVPRRQVDEQPYSPAGFLRVAQASAKPMVFRRVPLGTCTDRWADPKYLAEAEKDSIVSVHVATSKGAQLLDFARKNFSFRHVPFPALIQHVDESVAYYKENKRLSPEKETWYFRSIAANMKTERANLWTDFRNIGKDFVLPEGAHEFIMPRLHQSCLRINAAPLQLWTHYDTMDNVLCQVVGRKRVVMFPPSEYGNLYMQGSSSPVLDIDSPDLFQYPRFIDACKHATEVTLHPGDMLYFPANWYHHITTLADDPSDTYSVSVNVFFRHFEAAAYDKKDLYGNKDAAAVVALREAIVTGARKALESQNLAQDGADTPLPLAYKQLALQQALQDIERLSYKMRFNDSVSDLTGSIEKS